MNCWAEIIYFFWIQGTSLADLLQLNLHCFEENVRGIVDKAVKEMRMEKVLSELNSTWKGKGVWQESFSCIDEKQTLVTGTQCIMTNSVIRTAVVSTIYSFFDKHILL